MTSLNARQFASKIEYEGGVLSALEYGLKLEDIDPKESDLRAAWGRLETAWERLQPYLDAVEDLLEDIEPDDDDEE